MPQQFSSPPDSAMLGGASGQTSGSTWEYLVITCQPRESLTEVRRRIVEHAEYGKWELRRTLIYTGGVRKHWLRRRVMKVQRTL